MSAYALSDFVRDMTALMTHERDARVIVAAGKPLLKQLLQDLTLVPEPYRRQVHERQPSQFLLYRAQDSSLTVSSVVWGPGHSAPPHDHQTWGLLGLYDGQMHETRYRRVDSGSDPQRCALQKVAEVDTKTGEVWYLLPPDEEIHALENRSGAPVIEVHVYGRDLLHLPRQMFNLQTGTVLPFQTTSYDQ